MMAERRFLFLLASARVGGNSELLARRAANALPQETDQNWLRLSDLPLPAFEDIRHVEGGAYRAPTGHAATLLNATLRATDLVFAAPLYWYSVPASLKLYLDHWSGWMRVPGLDFRAHMAGKTAWAVSSYSDTDPSRADPLFQTLQSSAEYMGMRWGGQVLGEGNSPDDICADATALVRADRLFRSSAE